jgi:hypothetical protein
LVFPNTFSFLSRRSLARAGPIPGKSAAIAGLGFAAVVNRRLTAPPPPQSMRGKRTLHRRKIMVNGKLTMMKKF